MRFAAIAALAMACGGPTREERKPTADESDGPTANSITPLELRRGSVRPPIDLSQWVPDVEAEARWPLGFNQHPVDEPTFDIAGALADPGVAWRDLCRRGAQFRHLPKDQDLVEYLKAWCEEDEATALYELGLLQRSPIAGIAAAIMPDVARIAVSRGSSADLEGMLMRARLLDAPTADLVAASYLEIGRNDDAFAMTRLAADADHAATEATRCRRLVRMIVSTTGVAQDDAASKLHAIADPEKHDLPFGAKPVAHDPTCEQLDRDVMCWRRPSETCIARTAGDPERQLLRAIGAWPVGVVGFAEWELEMARAASALPLEDAYPLLIRSVEMELVTAACDRDHLDQVTRQLVNLRTNAGSAPPHDVSIARLLEQADHLHAMSRADCTAATRKLL